jgi:hypothetical protein
MSDDKQGWLQRLRADHTKERSERWIENYMARVNVGQSGPAACVGLKGPAERYDAAMKRVERIRTQAKAWFDQNGLSEIIRPFYLRYAFKLGKLIDNAWDETLLRQEVGLLVMTWVERGLDRDVMMRIARELFELELGESTNQERRA